MKTATRSALAPLGRWQEPLPYFMPTNEVGRTA